MRSRRTTDTVKCAAQALPRQWIALLLLAVPLWACNATDVGNPPSQPDDAQATFQLVATGPSGVAAGPIDHDGQWIDATYIAIESVSFNTSAGDSVSTTADGPVVFSPISGESSGDLGLELDAVSYASMTLDLGVVSLPPPGMPAELQGASVVIEGRRTDGARYVIIVRDVEPVSLTNDGAPFDVVAGDQRLFLSFDLHDWIESEHLDALPAADPIVVEADANPEIGGEFAEHFAESVSLYRDTNDNGQLDIGADELLAGGHMESTEHASEVQEQEHELDGLRGGR